MSCYMFSVIFVLTSKLINHNVLSVLWFFQSLRPAGLVRNLCGITHKAAIRLSYNSHNVMMCIIMLLRLIPGAERERLCWLFGVHLRKYSLLQYLHIDELAQNCSKFSPLTIVLLQSCANPSILIETTLPIEVWECEELYSLANCSTMQKMFYKHSRNLVVLNSKI